MARYLQIVKSAIEEHYINVDQSSVSGKQVQFEIKEFKAVGAVFTIEFTRDPALTMAAPWAPAKTFTVSGTNGTTNDGTYTVISNVGPIYTVVEAVVNESHYIEPWPVAIADDGIWLVTLDRPGDSDRNLVDTLLLDGTEWTAFVTFFEGTLTDTVIRAGVYVGWS